MVQTTHLIRVNPSAAKAADTLDAVGNRKTMVSGAGTTQYAYAAADCLTSVTPPGQSAVSYSFDVNGNLTSRGSEAPSGLGDDAERQ